MWPFLTSTVKVVFSTKNPKHFKGMQSKDKFHITIDGDSVEKYQEKVRDKRLGSEASATFKQTVYRSSTHKANVGRARGVGTSEPLTAKLYDGRGRTGRVHHLSLAEKLELQGENVMEFKVLQSFFEETKNRPATVGKIQAYIAKQTKREYTTEGLRAALKKLVQNGKLNQLYEKSENVFAHYPEKRTNKMMFFNMAEVEGEGFNLEESEHLTPPAAIEKIIEQAEDLPDVIPVATAPAPSVGANPNSEIERLCEWMKSNQITDFVLEIQFKD